jgi:hypothetical protein
VWRLKAGVLLVALSLWLVGCLDPCENRVLSELTAPNRNTRAVVFERSCGATTGFSTHVSILKASDAVSKSAGNIFVADSDHGVAKDMTVTARWAAPDSLVIRYPAKARVFRKETQLNGVAITYEIAP